MMINVVAILAYLIIQINIPVFAVSSNISIRLQVSTGPTQRQPVKCQV